MASRRARKDLPADMRPTNRYARSGHGDQHIEGKSGLFDCRLRNRRRGVKRGDGGKGVIGVVEGEAVPQIFIPQLIELYKQGKFPFDKLITFYDAKDINKAVEDSEKGVTIKPVIRFDR